MALLTNRIGPHEFIALRGSPELPKKKVRVDRRPGVNGVEITDEATSGEPFRMVSFVDVDDFEAGKELIQEYADLIADDAVTLVQGGVSSVDLNYKVNVLNVREVEVRKIGPSSGYKLSEEAGATVTAEWDLIAVEL